MSKVLDMWAGMTGTVLPFAGSSAPTGWLLCDGSAVSRSSYPNLFAKIGTTYGAGDGTTTFNLPDTRGEFIRGLDAGRGIDAGRVLGSAQLASTVRTNGLDSMSDTTWVRPTAVVINADATTTSNGERLMIDKTETTLEMSDLYENAVRPRNVALNHIIKA